MVDVWNFKLGRMVLCKTGSADMSTLFGHDLGHMIDSEELCLIDECRALGMRCWASSFADKQDPDQKIQRLNCTAAESQKV